MSFIRPAAREAIWRFGEPVVLTAVALWAIWQTTVLAAAGNWLALIPAGVGIVSSLAIFGSIERAYVSWKSRHSGAGVVVIDEGQIAFLGPAGGAVMALDMLLIVEIRRSRGRIGWHLADEVGQEVTIPAGAVGAEALLDRLGTLPGFDHLAVMGAMRREDDGRVRVWSRPD